MAAARVNRRCPLRSASPIIPERNHQLDRRRRPSGFPDAKVQSICSVPRPPRPPRGLPRRCCPRCRPAPPVAQPRHHGIEVHTRLELLDRSIERQVAFYAGARPRRRRADHHRRLRAEPRRAHRRGCAGADDRRACRRVASDHCRGPRARRQDRDADPALRPLRLPPIPVGASAIKSPINRHSARAS